MTTKGFGSDNHSGVHPELLKALNQANQGHAPAYETDTWSLRAQEKFRDLFQCPRAEVFFVFNGTAANVLGISSTLKSFQSVLVTEVSHMNVDECAAPESWGGFKLIPRPHDHGKFIPQDLEKLTWRSGDQHYAQIKMISLTQPTELGTCYSLEELKSLCQWAKEKNLYIHIDGARLANAVTFLKTDFARLCTESGVDVVSFGGTKNGLLGGEAVVFLNTSLAEGFKFYRKQQGQLASKTRFIAAQFLRYLEEDLWRSIAGHSLNMAQVLAEKLKQIGLTADYEVQSNAVFVRFPKKIVGPLRKRFFFYVWDEQTTQCRLMTSFDTTIEDIESFVSECARLLKSEEC